MLPIKADSRPTFRFPLSQPHLSMLERELVLGCFQRNQLTYGPLCKRFEREFADKLGVKYAVCCSSGTTALHLALLAAGIGPGDEVLVPDLSFIATANAVTYTGAIPVFCDVERVSWGMSPYHAEKKITEKTKAIIVVHLYGQAARLKDLLHLANHHKIHLIEDAAQGLGNSYNGQPLGTHGILGTFSFYGNKILTTGEGGMVVTDYADFAANVELFRGQGLSTGLKRRYFHHVVGYNYRMTEMQAAVGIGQLMQLDQLIEKRRIAFFTYDKIFSRFQRVQYDAAPWLYTIILPPDIDREKLMERLAEVGVETRPTFVPAHDLPMYVGQPEDFPISEMIGQSGLSLPTYPGLKASEAREIAHKVLEFIESNA